MTSTNKWLANGLNGSDRNAFQGKGRGLTSVIIIGAGVIGASVAFRMAQGGADVMLLEAGRAAGGTSTRSFAWTNAHNKLPHSYYALNAAGMRAHETLQDELGDGSWLHAGGCLEWASTPAELQMQQTRMTRLQQWGYAAEWITREQLRALEPDIEVSEINDAPIAYYPDEGWIDPGLLVAALLARVRALGGKLRPGASVVEITHDGGVARGVRLEGGEVLAADLVVNCAGATVNTVTPDTLLHVPMASTMGLLAITAPAATTLRRVVQAPGGIAFRPDGAGRVLMHSNDEDEKLGPEATPTPDMPAVARMLAAVARLLPAVAGVPAEGVRIGRRPIPEDGHPAVGEWPGLRGYHVVVTHSGVTLASLLGRAVADEALHGRHHPELDEFRPDRFLQKRRVERSA